MLLLFYHVITSHRCGPADFCSLHPVLHTTKVILNFFLSQNELTERDLTEIMMGSMNQ